MFGAEGYEQVIQSQPTDDEKDKPSRSGRKRDFLQGLSLSEKWEYLNSVSYNQFLVDKVGCCPPCQF